MIGERIKIVRNAVGLSQEAFSSKIGMKRSAVAQYEIGRNMPVDSAVALICREFNVNENWLRTGEGEMFNDLDKKKMEELLFHKISQNSDLLNVLVAFLNVLKKINKTDLDEILILATALSEKK